MMYIWFLKIFFINIGLFYIKKRLGQKSQPLNCLWIVEQDAVVERALLR